MDTVQIQARIFVSVQKIIKHSKTYEYDSHIQIALTKCNICVNAAVFQSFAV